MEGRKSDGRQLKKTEDKDMSSHLRSGFHKNSGEHITLSGAEVGKITLESQRNGDVHPLVESHHRINSLDLANQRNDELLQQLMGEQESGSIDFDQIAAQGMEWWRRRMDRMNPEELQRFYAVLGILKERMQSHLQQRIRIRDSNSEATSTSTPSTSTNGRGRRRRR
ncbi:hypothetical protein SLEP1_g58658 [Rubroshorea leprosula]|uniref:Uncharacterized protein n=1 Tax=Rubroshorea leprosula TaxID=152421 RepID=A0AAV5MR75_9ROSI|nr:hypothetical protein SLEP1_g58658 [Rubroshorea leprosula]